MCLDIEGALETNHDEEENDVETTSKELLNLIDRHEKRSQSNIESPSKVDFGTESEPKVVFIRVKLYRDLKNQLITLLNGFKEIFSWSSKDMPSLKTDIVVYRLPL